jgi:glutamine amidotransferase
MCRFFIYKGQLIKLNLLFEPNNSIIKQSFHNPFTPFIPVKNDRDHEMNGDGFGICWEKNKKLYSYKSCKPPWNDVNIIGLADYIESELFFCHVRAIRPFCLCSCVHEYNCHPFIYNHFSWMHNGDIKDKILICKYLYDNCSLDLITQLKGNTDSEYCFYLFLSLLDADVLKSNKRLTQSELKKYMLETIKIILSITKEVCSLNFSIYDGKTLICTRYINSETEDPPSLYYSTNLQLSKSNNFNAIISSEPITKNHSDWHLIPKNKMLILTQNNKIILSNIIS